MVKNSTESVADGEYGDLVRRVSELSLIFDTTTDLMALISLDADGGFRLALVNATYRNSIASNYPDFPLETLEGLRVDQMSGIFNWPPEVMETAIASYKEAVRTNLPVLRQEEIPTPHGMVYLDSAYLPTREASSGRSYILYTAHNISEQKRIQADLGLALRNRDLLIQELYHRTRNNLNVVASMLDLHSSRSGNPEILDLTAEVKASLLAMSLVHERLLQTCDLSLLDLGDYIRDLMRELKALAGRDGTGISLSIVAEPVRVAIDLAIPCGLILCELFSNARKYAFVGDRAGSIRIDLSKDAENWVKVRFADDGVGLPSGFAPAERSTLGFATILGIGEHQLQGEVAFESAHGFACILRFPLASQAGEP